MLDWAHGGFLPSGPDGFSPPGSKCTLCWGARLVADVHRATRDVSSELLSCYSSLFFFNYLLKRSAFFLCVSSTVLDSAV